MIKGNPLENKLVLILLQQIRYDTKKGESILLISTN